VVQVQLGPQTERLDQTLYFLQSLLMAAAVGDMHQILRGCLAVLVVAVGGAVPPALAALAHLAKGLLVEMELHLEYPQRRELRAAAAALVRWARQEKAGPLAQAALEHHRLLLVRL
jgi:hypothetical protein